MEKDQIFLEEWQRIIIGNNSPEFLLEVLIRSVLILLAFLMIVRLLGKRMNGQLTLTEMAVMLTLGAIVSPIMQLPDRGILLGLVILVCALAFQRGSTWLDFKSKRIETITQGTESLLIADGILQLDAMSAARISQQQVFAQLRSEKIYNVSRVSRMYMEACGLFSIYTTEDEKPGLSTFPDNDEEVHSLQTTAKPGLGVCTNCGNTVQVEEERAPCPVCRDIAWAQAVC